METKIVLETNELMIVDWSGPTGHGRLNIKYNGKGGFEIDAEYIGIETLIEILANLKK
jgi:hypothetical protein